MEQSKKPLLHYGREQENAEGRMEARALRLGGLRRGKATESTEATEGRCRCDRRKARRLGLARTLALPIRPRSQRIRGRWQRGGAGEGRRQNGPAPSARPRRNPSARRGWGRPSRPRSHKRLGYKRLNAGPEELSRFAKKFLDCTTRLWYTSSCGAIGPNVGSRSSRTQKGRGRKLRVCSRMFAYIRLCSPIFA
jgi:hypothetical protein